MWGWGSFFEGDFAETQTNSAGVDGGPSGGFKHAQTWERGSPSESVELFQLISLAVPLAALHSFNVYTIYCGEQIRVMK